ncbi:unnamed protein product [Boreogadus saida]
MQSERETRATLEATRFLRPSRYTCREHTQNPLPNANTRTARIKYKNIPILRIAKGYEARWYPGQVHAATTIQKNQRMCVARQLFRDRQAAALAVQTILRAYQARQKYQALLRESR